MDHDQNFKNLILDYPQDALEFFASKEAASLEGIVEVIPIRQQQLKSCLKDRYRELDVPLMVKYKEGRQEALLFVLEEETRPDRFSIYRLAHYCLDLSEMFSIERVVPVVIFLNKGRYKRTLKLGSDHQASLQFHYLTCDLSRLVVDDYFNSHNIVASLNLPNMAFPEKQKVDIYARAVRQFIRLEPRYDKRLKYLDFIDGYGKLTAIERQQYQQRYPQEAKAMTAFAKRYIEQGLEQGLEQLEQMKEQNLAKERHLLGRMAALRFTDFQEVPFRNALEGIVSPHLLEQIDEWIVNDESFAELLKKVKSLV